MKANELRLGNLFWVLHEESETVTTAAIQHLQSLQEYEDDPDDERWSRGGPNDYYAGIPLSKDWLERFGFEAIPNKTYVNGVEYILKADDSLEFNGIGTHGWISGKDKSLVVNVLCRGNYVCNAAQYVHQLQNLYFSLTGSELTIKESHANLNSK